MLAGQLVNDANLRAFSPECIRNRAANALRAARNNHNFILKHDSNLQLAISS